MLCDIVVAHYNEDIKWVNHLNHNNIRNIFVYHKKKNTKIFSKRNNLGTTNNKVINKQLPNIGRESHTYLTYCIDNYDNIPEFVYFLQGNPFAHGFSVQVTLEQIGLLSQKRTISKTNYGFHKTAVFWGLQNERIHHWAFSPTQPSKYCMSDWFKEYISKDKNIKLTACYVCFGANFGVSGRGITSRPKEDYIRLRDNELSTINPEAGHFMERSWYYLFNLHKL